MSSEPREHPAFPITFSSSVADDGWHAQKGPYAFESWHFDALSDDGRQALVISFYDNYPFSPRYFSPEHESIDGLNAEPHPAISLVYSVDGKPVINAVNEFDASDFSTLSKGANCMIGKSWFRIETAAYGTGYVISVELVSARNRKIKADLEWLSIEADMFRRDPGPQPKETAWNIATLRSDVSGRVTVSDSGGNALRVLHFRGTGCHDHLRSLRPLDETIASRWWGRGHFVDSTAIFQCLKLQKGSNLARLIIVRDGRIHESEAQSSWNGSVLSRFGLRIPRQMDLYTDEGYRLEIKPFGVIESGFCEIRLVGRMLLRFPDESPHETTGIFALLSPGRLRRRLVRRLSGLRIGTNRRPPLF
jgi:hypothetical protein